MSTITLNTKAYEGVGFNAQGQTVFKNTTSSYPSGFSYLTNSVKTGTGTASSVIRWNLSVPRVSTEASACACPGTVVGTEYTRIEVSFPSTCTAAERADEYLRILDLVKTLQFKATIESLTQAT